MAGHPIRSLDAARIQQDNVWKPIPFAAKDLDDAEFILSTAAAPNNEPVAVDFQGMMNADGSLMVNPSDIVKDILEYVGESNFDSGSFTAARNAFITGTSEDGEVTHLKPNIYIGGEMKAAEAYVSEVNRVAGTFLYIDFEGRWHYESFEPAQGDGVDEFSEIDLLSFSKSISSVDAFSKVILGYAIRHEEKWSEIYAFSRLQNRHHAGEPAEVIKEVSVPLWDQNDAILYAQRLLSTEALPLVKYQISVPRQGFLLLPGKQIRLKYDRHGLNNVVEVLEVKHDLAGNKVTLTCGDRRGWVDGFGFWVSDQVDAWNPGAAKEAKLAAKQSAGYWSGEDGLANSADGQSYLVSRWW